jgi:hypothetical protein
MSPPSDASDLRLPDILECVRIGEIGSLPFVWERLDIEQQDFLQILDRENPLECEYTPKKKKGDAIQQANGGVTPALSTL